MPFRHHNLGKKGRYPPNRRLSGPQNRSRNIGEKHFASIGYQNLPLVRAASSIVIIITALFLVISNVGELKCFHSEQIYKNT